VRLSETQLKTASALRHGTASYTWKEIAKMVGSRSPGNLSAAVREYERRAGLSMDEAIDEDLRVDRLRSARRRLTRATNDLRRVEERYERLSKQMDAALEVGDAYARLRLSSYLDAARDRRARLRIRVEYRTADLKREEERLSQ
jgi:hypothetical protein